MSREILKKTVEGFVKRYGFCLRKRRLWPDDTALQMYHPSRTGRVWSIHPSRKLLASRYRINDCGRRGLAALYEYLVPREEVRLVFPRSHEALKLIPSIRNTTAPHGWRLHAASWSGLGLKRRFAADADIPYFDMAAKGEIPTGVFHDWLIDQRYLEG